ASAGRRRRPTAKARRRRTRTPTGSPMVKGAANATKPSGPTPQERLKSLIEEALQVAATARKHGRPLSGVNFYANKMASLRSDATVAFGQLARGSVGDTTALAELMAKIFSVDAGVKERTQSARELQFALKTTWAHVPVDYSH